MEVFRGIFNTAGRIWAIFLGLVSAVLTFVALLEWENNWGLVMALGIFSAVCLGTCISLAVRRIPVKFLEDTEEINMAVNKRLKRVKKHLHYYGAAGFISDNPDWKDILSKIMDNPSVTVVRLLHLKKPEDLREPFTRAFGKEKGEEKVQQYRDLLRTHAQNLGIRSKDNFFYNFEGAPFWRYGLNHIVFDKKSVAIIAPCEERRRKAIIIDSPKIARELANSIEWIIRVLKPDALSEDDVLNLIKDSVNDSANG